MNEAIEPLGAAMHKAVAESGAIGGVTREVGTLFLHLTRYGNDWALELCDEEPIDKTSAGAWAQAVGAPINAEYHSEAHGKVTRFEWWGMEDAAPDTVRAFYLAGAK